MVQSTSTLNPYINPDGALVQRNLVLDTMIDQLPDKADELRPPNNNHSASCPGPTNCRAAASPRATGPSSATTCGSTCPGRPEQEQIARAAT